MKSILLGETNWIENTKFLENPTYKHKTINDLYLVTIPDKTIIHEHLEEELLEYLNIEPERLIFISRHRSKTGEPTLTTHPIGNYGNADFGGKPRTLTQSLPLEMARLLRIIKVNANKANLQHHVCYEVTHHGPYLQTPTLFAEVGSNEKEWHNIDACRVVALSVLELLMNEYSGKIMGSEDIILVGIGGGHYAPRFTDICFTKHAAFGHMVPTYQIKNGLINEDTLKKTLNATPNVKGVYFHRKSMRKSDVSHFKKICTELNIKVFSSTDLRDSIY
jgi:D-aminoacyl-tRNA deacylase